MLSSYVFPDFWSGTLWKLSSWWVTTEQASLTVLRAFKLILYLSVAMHWVACLYYTISEYEGLGSNEWVYGETEKGGDSFTRFDFRFPVKYRIIIPPNIIGPILLLKTYE